MKTKFKRGIPEFVIIIIVLSLLMFIHQSFNRLGGIFKPSPLPTEYVSFETFLSTSDSFFRTFWVPSIQKFAYYSDKHPAISGRDYLNDYGKNSVIKFLTEKDGLRLIQEWSVKYIIVPYDSSGEIFLKDNKYNNLEYLETIKQLSNIKWLREVSGFGKIAVFAVPNAKDHFWSPAENIRLAFKYISPVEYSLSVRNAKKGDRVVFAESYDAKWTASAPSIKYQEASIKYDGRFNSFVLPTDGDYSLKIYYTPQDYVNIGIMISSGSLIVSLITLLILLIKKK